MKGALVYLMVAVVAGLLALASHSGSWEQLSGGADGQYYNLLAAGFQKGQLSLDRAPPDGLAALPDPYDPAANRRFREASPPLHDLSYRNGKLYLYFGVTPALVLFLPFRILTDHALPQDLATWLFCVLGVAAGAVLLADLRRRFLTTAPAWALAIAIMGFGLATGLPVVLARSDVYEVAVMGGFCFSMISLLGVQRAIDPARQRNSWLAGASLSYGLAIGCRPSLLFGAVILILPLLVDRGMRSRLRSALWAILPIGLVGVGLIAYNFARFGSVAEFGQRFQLSSTREASAHFFSVSYLPTNLLAYFCLPPSIGGQFPFLGHMLVGSLPAGYLAPEDPYGLLLCTPFLCLAAAVPFLLPGSPVGLRWVGAAIGLFTGINALLLCLYFFACSRYEVEFSPGIGLLAGIAVLAWASRPGARHFAAGVCVILLLASLTFQSLAAFSHWGESQSDYALVLSQLGRTAEATAVLDRVVERAPGLPEAHLNRGAILARHGDLPEAIGELKTGLQLSPASPSGWQNLGDALAQSGQFAAAVDAFGKAIALQPASAELFSHRAYARARLNRNSEAMIDYGRSVQLDPDVLPVRLGFGMMLAESDRMNEAVVQFAEAVRIDSRSEEARSDLGTALASLGRYDQAIVQLQAALLLNRNDETVRENLVEALTRSGRVREARLVHDRLSP